MTKAFTLGEVAKHNHEKDCWLVIHGRVYDVTNFLDDHPGGYDIVVTNSGTGCGTECGPLGLLMHGRGGLNARHAPPAPYVVDTGCDGVVLCCCGISGTVGGPLQACDWQRGVWECQGLLAAI